MGYELGQDEIPYTHTSVSLCKLRKRILIDVALLITQIGIGLHHLQRKCQYLRIEKGAKIPFLKLAKLRDKKQKYSLRFHF